MPLSWSLDHVGPLACSAEDLALLLRAIAGRDPADPTTSLRPMPDYRHGLAAEVRGLRGARRGRPRRDGRARRRGGGDGGGRGAGGAGARGRAAADAFLRRLQRAAAW
ncbi:MAG: amidase family protein [Geminicoccaceae bacterium]